MTDGADGFDGQIEIVRRTRGYRRWPDDVKARIVAESFRPGVRVADVARRHGLASHQLSDWRRQARQGLLALPAEMMADIVADRKPAFVPVMVAPEEEDKRPADGSITIEFGGGVMMRVPGDIPEDRVMALVRALRSASTSGNGGISNACIASLSHACIHAMTTGNSVSGSMKRSSICMNGARE